MNVEDKLNNYKKTIDNIKIPDDLDLLVNNSIEKALRDNNSTVNKIKNKRKKFNFYIASNIAASFVGGMFVFGVVVNTSSVFAESMQDVPIIGALVRVVHFDSYSLDGNVEGTVEVPEIVVYSPITRGATNRTQKVTDINTEIENKIKETTNDVYNRADYDSSIMLDITYNVFSNSNTHLSFAVYATEASGSSTTHTYYYNINLITGDNITLQQVFGDDYINIVDEEIKRQIAYNESIDENNIYFHDENEFKTINDYTNEETGEFENFYINENDNIVICFDKYEIAAGYMGIQEFIITN